MKKATLFLPLILIIYLAGCAVKEDVALECIADEIPSLPAYYMVMDLPENVFLTQSAEEGRISLFTHRDYEILQEIFYAEDQAAAIRHISGQNLDPICAGDDGLRLAWVSAQDSGLITCSAVLLCDGDYYYSLCIRCAAELEKEYHQDFSRILSGVSLEPV